ncbi:MAG: TetR/AcrR family transcriptional regulator [bacterium]
MVSQVPRRAGRPANPVSRSELLAAARAAFAETGYAGASMSDIAARIGLRKASLFHHFRSKEALYFEMIADISDELGHLVVEADLGSGEFVERLDRLGAMVVRYLGTHPNAARLALRELVDGGPFSTGPGQEQVELSLQAVVMFLEAGMRDRAVVSQDPRQLAVSIIGLHLFHFAASQATERLFGGSLGSDEAVESRSGAVISQVRRLCGVPVT